MTSQPQNGPGERPDPNIGAWWNPDTMPTTAVVVRPVLAVEAGLSTTTAMSATFRVNTHSTPAARRALRQAEAARKARESAAPTVDATVGRIDAALEQRCGCGCGTRITKDSPSAWFATQECQWDWHQERAAEPAAVYAEEDPELHGDPADESLSGPMPPWARPAPDALRAPGGIVDRAETATADHPPQFRTARLEDVVHRGSPYEPACPHCGHRSSHSLMRSEPTHTRICSVCDLWFVATYRGCVYRVWDPLGLRFRLTDVRGRRAERFHPSGDPAALTRPLEIWVALETQLDHQRPGVATEIYLAVEGSGGDSLAG